MEKNQANQLQGQLDATKEGRRKGEEKVPNEETELISKTMARESAEEKLNNKERALPGWAEN